MGSAGADQSGAPAGNTRAVLGREHGMAWGISLLERQLL